MPRHTYKDGTTRRKPGGSRLHTVAAPDWPAIPRCPDSQPGNAKAARRAFTQEYRKACGAWEAEHSREPTAADRQAIKLRVRADRPDLAWTSVNTRGQPPPPSDLRPTVSVNLGSGLPLPTR